MLFGGALAAPGFAAEGQELSLGPWAAVGTVGNLVGSWARTGQEPSAAAR